jgi:hypothetical protein
MSIAPGCDAQSVYLVGAVLCERVHMGELRRRPLPSGSPGKARDRHRGIASFALLDWHHRILIGPAVHLFPPLLASAAVMRFADHEPYDNSRLGDYHVALHDARRQAARLAGDFVTVVAAWYHSLSCVSAPTTPIDSRNVRSGVGP